MPTISQKRLHEYLGAFSESTGIPVTLYTPEERNTGGVSGRQEILQIFEAYHQPGECTKIWSFRQILLRAGWPYIYTCP